MTTNAAPEQPRAFTYIDEETFLQLRNGPARVRKSVTEGFQRTVSVPADPAAASRFLPFTQTPPFISANDAMRELQAARAAKNKETASAPSSPQQRPKRTLADGSTADSDADANGDVDTDVDADELRLDERVAPASAAEVRAAREAAARRKEEKSKREIRPLKRSASRPTGVAVQSLPPGMFRFSHAEGGAAPAVAQIEEEDDWSGNFGASGGATGASGPGGAASAELEL
ncbi:hypothetical protein BD413DRAFT_526635 [Trametes elegans]|nr:hypothetical protein BD413DRAFT_526635 [Trametes elegans]